MSQRNALFDGKKAETSLLSYFTLLKYSGKNGETQEEDAAMAKPDKKRTDTLYQAILMLKDVEECRNFFEDLCTVAELRAIEQRFEVAQLLDDGLIYNDILERTGASSATISRVNRALNYGA